MDNELNILNQIKQLLQDNAVAIGKEELSLSAISKPLASVPDNAKSALIQVESDNTTAIVMRFWEDGSAPTSSSGMFRMHGDYLEITTTQNLKNFRAYGVAGTTKLSVTYYK